MTSGPATKHAVEYKNAGLRADSEQKATNGSKPKLTAKTSLESKVTKEVLAEKIVEKHVGAAITPEKSEEVGPSALIRKRRPEKLPLAYCSSYVIRLTKLDNQLS